MVKYGGGSKAIWSCFPANDTEEFHVIEGEWSNILGQKLMFSYETDSEENVNVLTRKQPHTSTKITQDWFIKKKEG